eukprot:2781980-Pyramimonas_sp.AAC.1
MSIRLARSGGGLLARRTTSMAPTVTSQFRRQAQRAPRRPRLRRSSFPALGLRRPSSARASR